MKTIIEKMLEEKGWDMEEDLIENNWGLNTTVVLNYIYQMPKEIQKKVIKTILKIEFVNGDLKDYFQFLAKGITNNF